jgi:D-aminoacyl-tRNA deacylase
MRVIIQRVQYASVTVEDKVCGAIDSGLLVLAGFSTKDTLKEIEWVTRKILQLRIMPDADGKMNLSVTETGGGILLVSQFTLYADCKKGNRPSYIQAAPPEEAKQLYEAFVAYFKTQTALKVQTGIFAADMKVQLLNDGPVTISLDTEVYM